MSEIIRRIIEIVAYGDRLDVSKPGWEKIPVLLGFSDLLAWALKEEKKQPLY